MNTIRQTHRQPGTHLSERQRRAAYNALICAELRQHGAIGSGPFAGADLLILHTTGRLTGQDHAVPLVAFTGDRTVIHVIGLNWREPRHPDWVLNTAFQPQVAIEFHGHTYRAIARILNDEERQPAWDAILASTTGFRHAQEASQRIIPVVEITPDA